jgi:hypothetical protein
MPQTVDISLGQAPEVFQLFSYANSGLALTDVISHGLNQTLRRDGYGGAWAYAYINGTGEYRVKIGSPSDDMSHYEGLITNYLTAGRLALGIYNEQGVQGPGFQFLLPFGLALANIRSVQLLHYPPTETFSYLDYLYSPTNIRWECLLVENGLAANDLTALERILDVVPIAADGGDSSGIDPYNAAFVPYGQAQLRNFLGSPVGGVTAPVVGYGGPVRDWLWNAYGDQIAEQLPGSGMANPLRPLSLVTLDVVAGAKTPVLCADHPSEYLYFTTVKTGVVTNIVQGLGSPPPSTLAARAAPTTGQATFPSPLAVMREDLVAAGWQCAMSKAWDADPAATLAAMNDRWKADADVTAIMDDQNAEFGYPSTAS